MQATRIQILEYLENHPGSSAVDLSRYLDMTPANIRYHLRILENNGMVQVSDQRSAGYAGRPVLLYNLTSQTLGENIIPLLKALLDVLGEREDYQVMLERISGQLLEDFQSEQGNRILSFNQAVAYLNQHHYRASWKATPDGPQIELRHCPYHNLAHNNSQLCQLDEQVVSSIFDTKLQLTQKRDFGKNPFSPCIFKTPTNKGNKGSNL